MSDDRENGYSAETHLATGTEISGITKAEKKYLEMIRAPYVPNQADAPGHLGGDEL